MAPTVHALLIVLGLIAAGWVTLWAVRFVAVLLFLRQLSGELPKPWWITSSSS